MLSTTQWSSWYIRHSQIQSGVKVTVMELAWVLSWDLCGCAVLWKRVTEEKQPLRELCA